MTLEILDDSEVPSDRFGRRERGGIAGSGLDGAQLACTAAVIAVAVLWVVLDAGSFIGLPLVVVLGLLGFTMFRFRGETFIALTVRPLRYFRRHLSGQTRFDRDVWHTKKEIEMKKGTPVPGKQLPVRIGAFDLPGASEHIHMYQSGHTGGGAFLIDFKEQTVALTIAVESQAWKLRDPATKRNAYDGFVEYLNSLTTLLGVIQVDARIRVDSAPATRLAEHAAAQDAIHPVSEVRDAVRDSYERLVDEHAPRSMEFSNFVTLTFATRQLAQQIKDNGGGLAGIDGYLNELVQTTITESIEKADVTVTAWLKARGYQARFSQAMDPVSFTKEMLDASPQQRREMAHPPVMAIRERPDRITVDGSIHQVFWLTEWPRNRKKVGFLDRLLYAGDGTRTLLLQLRPVPDHKASNRIVTRLTSLEAARQIRERRGIIETADQKKEREETEKREELISDGYADIEYRGFVAIAAGTPEELDRSRSAVVNAARSTSITMALMWHQQASAFATVVLPLNAKGKAA